MYLVTWVLHKIYTVSDVQQRSSAKIQLNGIDRRLMKNNLSSEKSAGSIRLFALVLNFFMNTFLFL